MRNKFDFFGIKTFDRRQILTAPLKENKLEVSTNQDRQRCFYLKKKKREFHY
jgi:hypothetical protein